MLYEKKLFSAMRHTKRLRFDITHTGKVWSGNSQYDKHQNGFEKNITVG